MSDTVRIRDERPEDHDAINRLITEAFQRDDEAILVTRLRASVDPMLSLVAEIDDRIVGHVFFSPVRIDASDGLPPPAGGLAPLSVHPDFRQRGIGEALARAGLERCPKLGWKAVFVLGDPDYYGRFGFEPAAPHGLHYLSKVLDDSFLVIVFSPDALAECTGWVHFDEAFE